MNANKQSKTKYILSLLLVAVSASLLIAAIITRKMNFNSFFGGRVIRANFAYAVMILGAVLMLFLFFLLIAALTDKSLARNKSYVVNVETATLEGANITPGSAEEGEKNTELFLQQLFKTTNFFQCL